MQPRLDPGGTSSSLRWGGDIPARTRSAWSVRGSPPPRTHATGSAKAEPWHARQPGPYAAGGPSAGPCPDSLIARAKTLAPRAYAAAESTPARLYAELDLGDFCAERRSRKKVAGSFHTRP
jgi:hypothetical protein